MSQCYFANVFLYHSRSAVTLAFLPRSHSSGPQKPAGAFAENAVMGRLPAKPLLCFTAVRANEERSFGMVHGNYLISDPVQLHLHGPQR